ncbi:MAG: flavodoxin family protein [Proteobacteria bacterium]|nr:flavodoxin family protein [Pseudomonadota bacterium]
MKILGISGSPRRGKTTDRLVKEVLGAANCETEFISLAGKKIAPCSACLACVPDNRCKIPDDMAALREKILSADAYVFGAPNYFSTLNSLTHCFLERLCQFRHRSGSALAGKYAAIVSIGGITPELPAQVMEAMLPYYQIKHVGTVTAQGAASCFTCGQGESCSVGAVSILLGPGQKITPENTPDLAKQPEKIQEARLLGKKIEACLLANVSAGEEQVSSQAV